MSQRIRLSLKYLFDRLFALILLIVLLPVFLITALVILITCGKPVLFSIDSPYNPVEEAGAGITVPPEDPEALSGAVLRLLEMPVEERQKMGQKGIAYVKKFHEMERLADRFDQLIKGLPSMKINHRLHRLH